MDVITRQPHSGIIAFPQKALPAIGRMALTNYSMHSIITSIIFYGFGFELFGKLQRFELYYVVKGIWIFQLITSPIRLKHVQYDPFKGLWGSLTHGKIQTFKNKPMKELNNRIQSLDFLKGLVIVLMALDHVRDYFHKDYFYFDPTDIDLTNFWIFFTRFITHFCAPVFVFLAGTSAYFVEQRTGKNAVSKWLLKRGLWLVFVEIIIINFGWRFQFNFNAIIFQVIWLLGASMLFLALCIHFPKKLMIPLCLLVIFGHNLLDDFTGGQLGDFWKLLHIQGTIQLIENSYIYNAYPLIPWIFVMPLGYYLGSIYKPGFDAAKRHRFLILTGIFSILLFFIIRLLNVYGDLVSWITYDDFTKTVLSFFNVTKYPPSLLFLLVTLGPSLIVLSLAEKFKGKSFEVMVLFGKAPMFFYIIHSYYIHLLAVLAVHLSGYDPKLMIIDVWIGFVPELRGYGFSLGVVYLIWVFVVASLYHGCKWFWKYKRKNRKYWWLSYL